MKEEIKFQIDEVDTGCCLTEKQIKDLTNRLHKAFIQAHVKVLNTMVSNCHKVDISDNEFKVIFDYEIKYNIAHLTKLLEDE